MNVVSGKIDRGLSDWKSAGAKILHLTSDDISVPKIILGFSKKIILLASGLHLEETSGPILLLKPDILLPILKPLLNKNVGFLIYPIINQIGLAYSENSNDKLLRYNDKGFNYNDLWGVNSEKCEEVKLVEKDTLKFKNHINLALSLHEDSETPKKGYIYANKIKKEIRNKIIKNLKSNIDSNLFAAKKDLLEAGEKEFQGGIIEEEFCIVDSTDKGSFENWAADDLGIPTVLSESPFGLDLETRINFHSGVISSVLTSLDW